MAWLDHMAILFQSINILIHRLGALRQERNRMRKEMSPDLKGLTVKWERQIFEDRVPTL